MSLYDVVLGDGLQHERSVIMLHLLGDPPVPRLRDAWIEKHDDHQAAIVLYTRQGGPNRECGCDDGGLAHGEGKASCGSNEVLKRHPLYLADADDGFDSTYATFWFRLPPSLPGGVRAFLIAAARDKVDTAQRWRDAIARVQSGDIPPALLAMGDQLAAMTGDATPGAPKVMEI